MTSTFRKIAFSTICTCLLFSADASKTEAGVVTDVWGAVFSAPGTPYFPSFRNSFYRASYQPYSVGYYPATPRAYRSRVSYRYSPLFGFRYRASYRFRPFTGFGVPYGYQTYYSYPGNGCCNPCALNVAPRNATGQLKPSPRTAAIPKTFSNKPNTANPKTNDSNGKTKREKQDTFKKTRPEKKKADATGAEDQQTFKIPSRNQDQAGSKTNEKKEELFPLKKKSPPAKNSKSKKKENGPKLVSTQSQIHLPNFDRKITWKTSPQKTRLVLNSFVENEKLSRSKYVPTHNRGWTPRTKGTHIGSK